MHHAFGVIISKKFLHIQDYGFFPMLTSRNFTVCILHFISVTHFELTFMKGIRSLSKLIFCMKISSCSSKICLKDSHCSISLPLGFCQRSVDYVSVFLGSFFVPLIYFFILPPILNCLDYFSFIVSLYWYFRPVTFNVTIIILGAECASFCFMFILSCLLLCVLFPVSQWVI